MDYESSPPEIEPLVDSPTSPEEVAQDERNRLQPLTPEEQAAVVELRHALQHKIIQFIREDAKKIYNEFQRFGIQPREEFQNGRQDYSRPKRKLKAITKKESYRQFRGGFGSLVRL